MTGYAAGASYYITGVRALSIWHDGLMDFYDVGGFVKNAPAHYHDVNEVVGMLYAVFYDANGVQIP